MRSRSSALACSWPTLLADVPQRDILALLCQRMLTGRYSLVVLTCLYGGAIQAL